MCVKNQTTINKILYLITKIRLISFLFIFLFIASCSINNEDKFIVKDILISEEIMKRDGESCFEAEEFDLTGCLFWGEDFDAAFDQYPGCTFVIHVAYYRCFDGQNYSFLIENVSLVSHDCDDFNNDVLNAEQNGTLDHFTLNFDIMIFKAARDFLGTSTPINTLSVALTYITASCNQYCWFTATKKGYTYYSFYKNVCGDGCCTIQSLYYYYDGNIVSETNDVTSTGDLQSYTNNDTCNAIGIVFSTSCIYSCDSYL